MTACVMFLESQKATMIGFSANSETPLLEVDIESSDSDSYYERLADSMESCSEVVLLGPDHIKGNFRRWILRNRRCLGKKVVAVLPANHITKDIARTYRNKYLR